MGLDAALYYIGRELSFLARPYNVEKACGYTTIPSRKFFLYEEHKKIENIKKIQL